MKALTSHRDEIFKKWVVDFLIEMGKKPTQFYFDYIDIRLMQRGDTTPESQASLKKNKNQRFVLINSNPPKFRKLFAVHPLSVCNKINRDEIKPFQISHN